MVTWALAKLHTCGPNVLLSQHHWMHRVCCQASSRYQSAACASHGRVYRLDLTSMGKRSPQGQTRGHLVPFSLTTTYGRCRHTRTHTLTGACPITDLIAAMTATGSAFWDYIDGFGQRHWESGLEWRRETMRTDYLISLINRLWWEFMLVWVL